MADNLAHIDRLNEIIETLDDDAASMHELIKASTTQLEAAVHVGAEAAEMGRETVETVAGKTAEMAEAAQAFFEEQERLQRTILKENEAFRDQVQTDLLQGKSDQALRIDTLGGDLMRRLSALGERIDSLEKKTAGSTDTFARKLHLALVGIDITLALEAAAIILTLVF